MLQTFEVEDTFEIAGRGVVVVGGEDDQRVSVGCRWIVEIITPEGENLRRAASKEWLLRKAEPLDETTAFLVLDTTKKEIPIGTIFNILAREDGVSS